MNDKVRAVLAACALVAHAAAILDRELSELGVAFDEVLRRLP